MTYTAADHAYDIRERAKALIRALEQGDQVIVDRALRDIATSLRALKNTKAQRTGGK